MVWFPYLCMVDMVCETYTNGCRKALCINLSLFSHQCLLFLNIGKYISDQLSEENLVLDRLIISQLDISLYSHCFSA